MPFFILKYCTNQIILCNYKLFLFKCTIILLYRIYLYFRLASKFFRYLFFYTILSFLPIYYVFLIYLYFLFFYGMNKATVGSISSSIMILFYFFIYLYTPPLWILSQIVKMWLKCKSTVDLKMCCTWCSKESSQTSIIINIKTFIFILYWLPEVTFNCCFFVGVSALSFVFSNW